MRENVWLRTTLAALRSCTDKQRTVYMLHVGLTPEGTQRSPIGFADISRALGMSRQTAREYFQIVDAKVSKALFRQAVRMLPAT